jgi:hypothetical protein
VIEEDEIDMSKRGSGEGMCKRMYSENPKVKQAL